jgi:hypothetical protein
MPTDGARRAIFQTKRVEVQQQSDRKAADAQVGLQLYVTGRQQRRNRFSRITVSSTRMSARNPSGRGSPLYIAGIRTSRLTRMPARSNSRHNTSGPKC